MENNTNTSHSVYEIKQFISFKNWILILLFLPTITTVGQNALFEGNAIILHSDAPKFEEQFYQYQIFEIDIAALNSFVQASESNKKLRLKLADKYDWKFEIYPNYLVSPQYTLQKLNNGQATKQYSTQTRTYEGHFDRNKGEVNLTMNNEFLFGFFRENEETFFIEPANFFAKGLPSNQFVIYPVSAIIPNDNHTCGWNKTLDRTEEVATSAPTKAISTDCAIVDLAIASDYLMYTEFGSNVANVEAHNFGIMNTVQANFRHEFTDNIEYRIVTQTVATSNPDAWTASTDASVLLADFRTWGEGGGFGATSYNLGQFWTTRDIVFSGSSSTIGLAYRPGICGSFSYHILEYSSGLSAAQKRVLVAHEIGHNWNATHDASGAAFIMAPSVNTSTDWSSTSVTAIDGRLTTANCINELNDCSTVSAPIANFVTEGSTAGCVGSVISFKDFSQYGESRSWTFTGGIPATSSDAKVDVTYAATASYNVSILSTNAAGSNLSSNNVSVIIDNPPAAPSTPSGTPGGGGITTVSFGNMNNSSSDAAGAGTRYEDFSCDAIAELSTSTTYQMTIGLGDCSAGPLFERFALYIDYNDDGDFDDAGENAHNSGGVGFCGTTSHANLQFTTPAFPTFNVILRARAISDNAFINSASHNPTTGQVEDYGVVFLAPLPVLPVELSDFSGEKIEKEVRLIWETSSETNNDYFEIERSSDGINFSLIGRVTGAGTSSTIQNYSLLDTEPIIGLNYYRLKQIDFDGKFTTSEIISVVFEEETELELHPNPIAGSNLNLKYKSVNFGEVEIQVYGVAGRLIKSNILETSEGMNNLQIDIQELGKGTYFLQTVQGNLRFTKRFIRL